MAPSPSPVASSLEQIGHGCSATREKCVAVLKQFPGIKDTDVAHILSVLCKSAPAPASDANPYPHLDEAPSLTPWNVRNLAAALKEVAPSVSWQSAIQQLDFPGFFLKDHNAFVVLLYAYSIATKDPFPISVVFGKVWNNAKGQLSILRFAAAAPAEVFSFDRVARKQSPLENLHGHKLPSGTPNSAWLSLDLLETLCSLGDVPGLEDSVLQVVAGPMRVCPELLTVGLAQAQPPSKRFRTTLLHMLLPAYLGTNPDSSVVLRAVWAADPSAVLASMVDVHTTDPACISRLLDVCHDLKALTVALQDEHLSFVLDLASLAARREYLNLEKWLTDHLTSSKEMFFEACLQFLRGHIGKAENLLPLSDEIVAIYFKVLPGFAPHSAADSLKRLFADAVAASPSLAALVGPAGAPASDGLGPSEGNATEIEEQANAYLERMYNEELSIQHMVEMLTRFSKSSVQRERDVFQCLIQSLFEEYSFLQKYPDRELRITAILFGSLVKHQLVVREQLGDALVCVRDALKAPRGTKVFTFGLTALEQFSERLSEWPVFCQQLLQTQAVREAAAPALLSLLEKAAVGPASAAAAATGTAVADGLPHGASEAGKSNLKEAEVGPGAGELSAATSSTGVASGEQATGSKEAASTEPVPPPVLVKRKQELLKSSRDSSSSVPSRAPKSGFGHALSIETLVAAAEKRESSQVPAPEVQDKVAFIINNISTSNLDAKAKELLDVLKEPFFIWFAEYLVMKRASIEPNFHDLYLRFLDQVNARPLHKQVVVATYENCKVLLSSHFIRSSSEERSLLKNLGSWLGRLTIGRNQPLRSREIDPKALIIEAYEKGLMIAVIPFTSKIMEPCASSTVYQPPNPWTVGILSLLTEIYNLPSLKLNLKFDIEVLFKNLGVDMKEMKPTQLLVGRQRELEGNPDFSNKELLAHLQAGGVPPSSSSPSPVPAAAGAAAAGTGAAFSVAQAAAVIAAVSISGQASTSGSPQPGTMEAKAAAATSQAGADVTSASQTDQSALSSAGKAASDSSAPGPQGQDQQQQLQQLQAAQQQAAFPLPNLSAFVVINPKLAPVAQQLQLARIVPVALDRAIREIVAPVVERSCSIACMTTRELVLKDFAMEADDSRTQKAAQLMVASLAGSLALVTCKEPLRVATATSLRSLLQPAIGGADLEQVVQVLAGDHLDLGCAVIEKAASDKALRDLDEVLTPALVSRRKQREALGSAYYDALLYSQSNLARLPEALRPKPGRISAGQQRVYEDFGRLPWQAQGAPGASSLNLALPSTSTAGSAAAAAGTAAAGPFQDQQPEAEPRTAASRSVTPGIPSEAQMQSQPRAQVPQLTPPAQPQGQAEAGKTGVAEQLPQEQQVVTQQQQAEQQGLQTQQQQKQQEEAQPAPEQLPEQPWSSAEQRQQQQQPQQAWTGGPSASGPAYPPQSDSSVGSTPVQLPTLPEGIPTLSASEVLERVQVALFKVDAALAANPSALFSSLPADHELRSLVSDIQLAVFMSVGREEVAVAIAQKLFQRLFDNPLGPLHVSTHSALLEALRDVCPRLPGDITAWLLFSPEERRLQLEVTLALMRAQLISLPDYNIYLAKLMEGGHNVPATEFAINLVRMAVIREGFVSAAELFTVIDAFAKMALRPGAPELFQQLVEAARSRPPVPREDRAKAGAAALVALLAAAKEKKLALAGDASAFHSLGVSPQPQAAVNRDYVPPGFREQAVVLFDEWVRVSEAALTNDKAVIIFLSQMQHSGMLKTEESAERFFRVLSEMVVIHCLSSEASAPPVAPVASLAAHAPPPKALNFTAVDVFSRLIVLLVKYYVNPLGNPNLNKVNLLNKVMAGIIRAIHRESDERKLLNPRPYFRLLLNLVVELTAPDPASGLDAASYQVLSILAATFQALQPLRVPSFSFSWLELVSHRSFMPLLLLSPGQKGWPAFQRLLLALFRFLEPFLGHAEFTDPIRLLYKGTLRVLLVLLHDFPEFLCDHHFSFCDVIPTTCIQMRNLILSAFPRSMRLPDPFTPNLKVDLLPEISQPPRILSDVEAALRVRMLKADVDQYLQTRQPLSFLVVDLKQRLLLPPAEAVQVGCRYDVPLINSLILYVGMQAIQQLQSKTAPQQLAMPSPPITQSAPMDVFQQLVAEMDSEGRYLVLNAIANQLRFPNNHTHYFSCVLLFLFAESNQEFVKEQITRVLFERLIVNRPHPWGLLITFIELIKNPRYNFWSHSFTHCAPEIKKLFESVARSCMGPPPTAEEEALTPAS